MARDYNVLLKSEKCSRFYQFRVFAVDMREFSDCLERIGVFDHSYVDPCFT